MQVCLNSFLLCPYRVEVATNLERSLQQGRDLLSSYENKLVIDDTVPEDLRVVDRKKEELLVSFCPVLILHMQNHFPKAVVTPAQLPSWICW